MNAQELLQEISDYCRQTGLAESTFGRRAVNDGKLASRLRHGGRITTETLDRIRTFMATNRGAAAHGRAVIERSTGARAPAPPSAAVVAGSLPHAAGGLAANADPQRNFRFFDNRQKYLLFVNTCSREVGGGAPRLARARQHPSAPTGGARCSTPASATARCWRA